MRYCCTLSLTSALGVGRWSRPLHAPATLPAVKGLGTHCAGAQLVPGPVWTGPDRCQILRLHGVPSPDRPVRSEFLYRLSYRQRVVVLGDAEKNTGLVVTNIWLVLGKQTNRTHRVICCTDDVTCFGFCQKPIKYVLDITRPFIIGQFINSNIK